VFGPSGPPLRQDVDACTAGGAARQASAGGPGRRLHTLQDFPAGLRRFPALPACAEQLLNPR